MIATAGLFIVRARYRHDGVKVLTGTTADDRLPDAWHAAVRRHRDAGVNQLAVPFASAERRLPGTPTLRLPLTHPAPK